MGYANPIRLEGTVVSRETGEPLKGVSVYLDGTTTYTVTRDDGTYSLLVPQGVNTPMILSHYDYKISVVNKPFEALPDTVYLELRQFIMAEVVVTAIPFEREAMMRMFRSEFLGSTEEGLSCTIENEDDIRFFWNAATKTITAASDTPLRIKNGYLGYTVVFDLHYFTVQLQSGSLSGRTYTVYLGSCSFFDTSEGRKVYARRRDQVYYSSFRSLMNSLVTRPVQKADFWILNGKHNIDDISQMEWEIADTLSMKRVKINRSPVKVDISQSLTGSVYDSLTVKHRGNGAESKI